MGWSWYFPDAMKTRKALVADLLANFEAGPGRDTVRCLRSCYKGAVHSGVLWSLWERTAAGGTLVGRFVACHLIRHRNSSEGRVWGYKGMDMSQGPRYYSCPLAYVDACSPYIQPHTHAWSWALGVRLWWRAAGLGFRGAERTNAVFRVLRVVGESVFLRVCLGSDLARWTADGGRDPCDPSVFERAVLSLAPRPGPALSP